MKRSVNEAFQASNLPFRLVSASCGLLPDGLIAVPESYCEALVMPARRADRVCRADPPTGSGAGYWPEKTRRFRGTDSAVSANNGCVIDSSERGVSMVRLRYALGASLVAAMSVSAIPVLAADSGAVSTERHCVYFVVDEFDDGQFVTTEECFGSFAEAATYSTGGEVVVPEGTTPHEYIASGGAAAASSTLGIHYDYFNGGGSSITIVGSGCTGGYWNTPSWFDNRTSSSYAGCYRLRHFNYPYLSGSSYTTYGSGQTHNLYAFNNKTESVQYLS